MYVGNVFKYITVLRDYAAETMSGNNQSINKTYTYKQEKQILLNCSINFPKVKTNCLF
jgi:hypothetical protein